MYDKARYVGDIPNYRDQIADVRPHEPTYDLPLEQRKLFARFDNQDIERHDMPGIGVGKFWHVFPAKDFWLLTPINI